MSHWIKQVKGTELDADKLTPNLRIHKRFDSLCHCSQWRKTSSDSGPYEGFYNFSDICVPVDLFTPSLYKFDVTGKDIEDNHIMEPEHEKENYSIYRWIYSNQLILQLSLHDAKS